MKTWILGLAALFLLGGVAEAAPRVGITIGSPVWPNYGHYYVYPAPIYRRPPVYYAPPVYVYPPVYQYQFQPYYYQPYYRVYP